MEGRGPVVSLPRAQIGVRPLLSLFRRCSCIWRWQTCLAGLQKLQILWSISKRCQGALSMEKAEVPSLLQCGAPPAGGPRAPPAAAPDPGR